MREFPPFFELSTGVALGAVAALFAHRCWIRGSHQRTRDCEESKQSEHSIVASVDALEMSAKEA